MDGGTLQPLQLDAFHARVERELSNDVIVRVHGRRQRPAGGHDQHPRAPNAPSDLAEQQQRRLVGPLKIIEDNQQAVRLADPSEQEHHIVEQGEPPCVVSLRPTHRHRAVRSAEGNRPRIAARQILTFSPAIDRQLLQRDPPQAIRRGTGSISRTSPHHSKALVRSGGRHRSSQTGLADPRLTRDDHQPAPPRARLIKKIDDASPLPITGHNRFVRHRNDRISHQKILTRCSSRMEGTNAGAVAGRTVRARLKDESTAFGRTSHPSEFGRRLGGDGRSDRHPHGSSGCRVGPTRRLRLDGDRSRSRYCRSVGASRGRAYVQAGNERTGVGNEHRAQRGGGNGPR